MISIPEPCTENWRKMTPGTNGRFCGSCQKTVVDFTKKSNEEIAAYFLTHGDVCGKYRASQVEAPLVVRRQWKWLATALIFVFGASFVSSCVPRKGRRKFPIQLKAAPGTPADSTKTKRIGLFSLLIGAVLFTSSCIGKRYMPPDAFIYPAKTDSVPGPKQLHKPLK